MAKVQLRDFYFGKWYFLYVFDAVVVVARNAKSLQAKDN